MKKLRYFIPLLLILNACQESEKDENAVVSDALTVLSDMPPQMLETLGIDKNTDFRSFDIYQRQHITYANSVDTSKWVAQDYVFIKDKAGHRLALEVDKKDSAITNIQNIIQVNNIVFASAVHKNCGTYEIDSTIVPPEVRPLYASTGAGGVYIEVLWAKGNPFVKIQNDKWVDVKSNKIVAEIEMSKKLGIIFNNNIDRGNLTIPNNLEIKTPTLDLPITQIVRDVEIRNNLKK